MTICQKKPSKLSRITAFLRRQKKTVLLIITVAAITLAVSGIVSMLLEGTSIIKLPSVGYIHTIGVRAYWDLNLTDQTTQINWGTVFTGSTSNVTLYLRSTSNVPTTLTLTAANWTYTDANNIVMTGPSNSTPYLNLTWNYNNQTLNPIQTLPTRLTLTIDNSPVFIAFLINNKIQQFTMDITIQANEK